ncbi:MAG TPA: hypothetical protein VMN58_03710, partial [Acidimicrobiales bacterium]|nr:hypothetical protein [Acidimicrobiales bacterium]
MFLRVTFVAALLVASAPVVSTAQADEEPTFRAGVGVADATWHVGAGAGQYADKEPAGANDSIDPHQHSLTQSDSYGVQSRLTMRAIVVEGTNGERVALLKSDLYLAQNHLLRRAGQLLAEAGSSITADEILHTASHNHSSPYYSTPSWGVWLFQDAVDLRNLEYVARAMRDAVLEAEASLRPATMGATTVEHSIFKANIAGRGIASDGTPYGHPLEHGDLGLTVLRFDDANSGEPIAVWANFGQHPEGLDGYDLITADFLAPLERFVERHVGAPLVFSQGDVGSAEGPYESWANAETLPDGTIRAWAHVGHAQIERGARLLADSLIEAWEAIGTGDVEVPPSSDVPVGMITYWAPGPVSHPYPSVSNCRTQETAEGKPGLPILGLPDCSRPTGSAPVGLPFESLKLHGIPVPDHYDAPSFTAVQENLRLQLQAVRLGDVVLGSCACEAQADLILNFESRADDLVGLDNGFAWDELCDGREDGTWACPDPGRDDLGDRSLIVDDGPFQRMRAQVHNDAAGWDDPAYAPYANSEPTDPDDIKGNFTHEELPSSEGYPIAVGLGHAGDYNGYTVSYREYMSRDTYRKALTSHGAHTADYMVTRLVRMAGALKRGEAFVPDDPLAPAAAADEARQEATSQAIGRAAGVAYDAWQAALADDVGPAGSLEQPAREIKRFSGATFSWRGGSNAVDNPTVAVERLEDGAWVPYADQSGEVQTILAMPAGVHGVADTHTGGQEWRWTASFEAFDAFPATLGQVPDGTYRFVVDGVIRQARSNTPYHLESDPFAVVPWDGIAVHDLRLEDGGSVSFIVDPIEYPRTYSSPIRMVRDDGRNTICKTCSFRPWARTGEVSTATVTVLGPNGKVRRAVDATLQDGRWVAATRLKKSE